MGYKYSDIIQFKDVKDTGTAFGSATLGIQNNFNYNDDFDTVTSINIPVLNAVEIDWNGAVLPAYSPTGLNTTGEILNVLNKAYDYATTYNVKYSSGKLYDDKGTEIKVGSDVTATTVSGWGFTKNVGTVTGVKINGSTKSPSNGVVDLGTVITDISGKANTNHTHTKSQITDFPTIPSKTSQLTNDSGFTSNVGTVTGVKINGSTKNPSNGVVDLGTVITQHQDISGKANASHTHAISDITNLSNTLSSINSQITDLLNRIAALENSKIYEVKSVTLSNLTCTALSSAKTLPATGGTFTITANTGYSLPTKVTVTNATGEWSQSTGVLKISNVTGEVTVSASGDVNKPTSIKIYNAAGTAELNTAQTITGTNGTLQIKVNVTGSKTLLSTQSQFKVTTIPTGITVKNGSTAVTTSTVLNTGTVLTISGNALMSAAANLVVTATAANTSLTDSLSVKVNEGSVTKVDITTTNTTTSNSNGGNVTIALSVTETMFGTPTITWSCDGGTLNNKTINGATFVAPANTTTSNKVYTITAKYNDTLKDSITVTVPGKVESTKYYWYVGNTSPEGMTPPSVGSANSTLCQWTDLGSSLPTTSIKVYKADEVNYDDHTWYVAAPTQAGFVLYDAFNSEEELGYKKTKTFMVGTVSYDLWVRQSQGDQAFVWLHK